MILCRFIHRTQPAQGVDSGCVQVGRSVSPACNSASAKSMPGWYASSLILTLADLWHGPFPIRLNRSTLDVSPHCCAGIHPDRDDRRTRAHQQYDVAAMTSAYESSRTAMSKRVHS